MSGPIDRFLEDVRDRLRPEVEPPVLDDSIAELRSHLSESADEIEAEVPIRELAEERAVRQLGKVCEKTKSGSEFLKQLASIEAHLKWKVFGFSFLVILLPILPLFGGIPLGIRVFLNMGLIALLPIAVFIGVIRGRKIGLVGLSASMICAGIAAIVLSGVLSSFVPPEVGNFAWRWELPAKQAEYVSYQGNISNFAVENYYSIEKPNDRTYEVAKSNMWEYCTGGGVWGSIKMMSRSTFPMALWWAAICFGSGLLAHGLLYLRPFRWNVTIAKLRRD